MIEFNILIVGEQYSEELKDPSAAEYQQLSERFISQVIPFPNFLFPFAGSAKQQQQKASVSGLLIFVSLFRIFGFYFVYNGGNYITIIFWGQGMGLSFLFGEESEFPYGCLSWDLSFL